MQHSLCYNSSLEFAELNVSAVHMLAYNTVHLHAISSTVDGDKARLEM